MTGTTPITHYRLCNGKLRHRSAACGLTVIPFLRGSGVINKTDALRLSNPPLPEENLQATSRFLIYMVRIWVN